MKERTIRYFEKPGPACTGDVLKALQNRLAEAGPAHLVVASISGRTALRLARPLTRENLKIACVTGPPSWDIYPEYSQPRLQPAIRSDLEGLGVAIVDRTPSSFSDTVEYSQARFGFAPPSWLIVETLVAVGATA